MEVYDFPFHIWDVIPTPLTNSYVSRWFCNHQPENEGQIAAWAACETAVLGGSQIFVERDEGVISIPNWLVVWNDFYFSIYWE